MDARLAKALTVTKTAALSLTSFVQMRLEWEPTLHTCGRVGYFACIVLRKLSVGMYTMCVHAYVHMCVYVCTCMPSVLRSCVHRRGLTVPRSARAYFVQPLVIGCPVRHWCYRCRH